MKVHWGHHFLPSQKVDNWEGKCNVPVGHVFSCLGCWAWRSGEDPSCRPTTRPDMTRTICWTGGRRRRSRWHLLLRICLPLRWRWIIHVHAGGNHPGIPLNRCARMERHMQNWDGLGWGGRVDERHMRNKAIRYHGGIKQGSIGVEGWVEIRVVVEKRMWRRVWVEGVRKNVVHSGSKLQLE